MGVAQLRRALHQLRDVLVQPAADVVADGELLRRFTSVRDEAAFTALLRRHGLLVLSVARRVLRDQHAAEDVFQATFLVLLRKAASLDTRPSLANWLYTVAFRLALKASAARRVRLRSEVSPITTAEPLAEVMRHDLEAIVDEEVNRLPWKYRQPILLCYFEGQTHAAAAQQLGWPKGTLSGRLARARERLRTRLARRGLVLSVGMIATGLMTHATAAVPTPLLTLTVRRAAGVAAGQALVGLPSAIALLVEVGCGSSFLARGKLLLALLLLAAATIGAGWLAEPVKPPQTVEMPAPVVEKPQAPVTLPVDAVARLGSDRFRHRGFLKAVAFLPDGRSLVAADENDVILWETATGKEIRRFLDPARRGGIQTVALSPDGRLLAETSNYPGTLRLWDVASGRLLHRSSCNQFSWLEFAPDSRALATFGWRPEDRGATLLLWDVATGEEMRRIEGANGEGMAVAFSPDGKTLFAAERAKDLHLWDTATGNHLGQIDRTAAHLAVSPDGKLLATIEFRDSKCSTTEKFWRTENAVRLIDGATRKEVRRIVVPQKEVQWPSWRDNGGIYGLVFTPDGKMLLSCDPGRTILGWEVATGKERLRIELPGKFVAALAMSPDGRTLATGGLDQTIHLWDLATSKEVNPPGGHQEGVRAVAISPDGRTIASGSEDHTLRLWDAKTGQELRRFVGHEDRIETVAFVDGGRQLVSSAADQSVRLWEVSTGRELRRFPGTGCWSVSQEGERLALRTATREMATFDIWDLKADKRVAQIAQVPVVWGAGLSPDGRTLATCGEEKHFHIWDVASGKLLRFSGGGLGSHTDRSNLGCAFSADGRWAALGAYGDRAGTEIHLVILYDLSTGKEVHRMEDLGRPLAFSADGRLLACVAGERTDKVRLMELATGRECSLLSGHKGSIHAASFSPDGRTLVTASADTTLLVWDLTGRGGAEPPLAALSDREWEERWSDLGVQDAARAYRAVWALAAAPRQSVPRLTRQLPPLVAVEARRLERLTADLDSDDFAVREQATRELEDLDRLAEPALAKVSQDGQSVEAKQRAEGLLNKLHEAMPSGERLREARAVLVLEQIGTREARQVLTALAAGAPGMWRTREAKAALERLRAGE